MSEPKIVLTAIDRTKQAFDSFNRNLQGVGERVNTMLPVLGRIGPAMASGFGPATIGAAITGLAAITKAQADAVDAYNDLKDATGASIENISALDEVGRRSGATFETVSSSLVKFNAALGEASDPQKGAGAVFKALGLDVQRLKQLDPAEAMRQTAQALSGFADDGNKARAVQELFGKSVREVAPLLKDLSEQSKLVAKVTTEEAEAAEKFNKQLFAMQASLNDIGRTLAMPVIQGFNNLVAGIKDANKESESWVLTMLKLQPHLYAMLQVATMMGARGGVSAGEARGRIADIDKLLQGDPSLTKSEREALAGERSRLLAQRNDAYAGEVTGAESADALSRRFGRASLNVPEKGKKEKKEKDDKDWLWRREQWLKQYDEQEKQRKEIEDRAAQDLAQWMERWAQEGDAMSRRLDAEERSLRRQAELDAELDNLSGRKTSERNSALRGRLGERVAEGSMSGDEARKAIENIDDATKKASDSAKSFGGAFTSALDDVLFRAESVGDVLKGLAMNVVSIGLQQSITQPLGAMVGNWMGGMFSFDGGGYTGNRPRAGGMDGKGGFLAMLHPQETVVDHTTGDRARGGAATGNTYITVNATDNASKGDLRRAVLAGQQQALARQRRAVTYGGA